MASSSIEFLVVLPAYGRLLGDVRSKIADHDSDNPKSRTPAIVS